MFLDDLLDDLLDYLIGYLLNDLLNDLLDDLLDDLIVWFRGRDCRPAGEGGGSCWLNVPVGASTCAPVALAQPSSFSHRRHCAQAWQQQWEGGEGGDERQRAAAALDEACRVVEALGEQFYPSDNRWACCCCGWVGGWVGARGCGGIAEWGHCRGLEVGGQGVRGSRLPLVAARPATPGTSNPQPICPPNSHLIYTSNPQPIYPPTPPHPCTHVQLPRGTRPDAARAGGGRHLARSRRRGAGQRARTGSHGGGLQGIIRCCGPGLRSAAQVSLGVWVGCGGVGDVGVVGWCGVCIGG